MIDSTARVIMHGMENKELRKRDEIIGDGGMEMEKGGG